MRAMRIVATKECERWNKENEEFTAWFVDKMLKTYPRKKLRY